MDSQKFRRMLDLRVEELPEEKRREKTKYYLKYLHVYSRMHQSSVFDKDYMEKFFQEADYLWNFRSVSPEGN